MDDNKTCLLCGSNKTVRYCNSLPACQDCLDSERKAITELERSKKVLYPEINEIIPNKLFLGNYDYAKNIDNLKMNNITHILICGTTLEPFFPDSFVYQQLPIEDFIEQDIKSYFIEAIQFIEKGDVVFVHCHAGISRSAAIVIAYIMWKNKCSYDDAKNFVKSKRKCIFPNQRFVEDLKRFSEELVKDNYELFGINSGCWCIMI